jgi:hypothetical protein
MSIQTMESQQQLPEDPDQVPQGGETGEAGEPARSSPLGSVRDLLTMLGPLSLVFCVCYVLSAAVLTVALVNGSAELFFAAYAVNYTVDWCLRLNGDYLHRLMRRFGFGVRIRELFRLLALVCLALVTDTPGAGVLFAIAGALFVLTSVHGPLVSFRTRRRNLPIAVLNLDMSELRVPDGPRMNRWSRHGINGIPGAEPVITVVFAAVVAGAAPGWLWLSAVVPAVALCAVLHAAWHALRNRALPDREELLRTVNAQLAEYRPEVALYFTFAAAGEDFMYQVNMWLDALEQLDRRPVLLLRETSSLWRLEPTRLPVVCVRKTDDLAALELPDVRVVLYPGNAGKNVHMLQRAEMQHVFIGHGDSDKLASSNRVSRVFDQIWVAGQAGSDRYRRVRHAIDPGSLVQVGRPQVDQIRAAAASGDDGTMTVLYGPTWEGWTDEACHTSVIPMGEKIIGELLRQGGIRVIYKPHPLTGKRSPQAREAHALIEEALRADNERRADQRDPARVAEIEERLAELSLRIAERAGRLLTVDRAQRTRDARPTTADIRGELAALRLEWGELYWSAGYQGGRHLVVTGRDPSLYECFGQADLLISDMSSVISDFVATGKPYLVTNADDVDPHEYRLLNPTAGAAYLLDSSCADLADILSLLRRPGPDPMARRRQELGHYLLGPDGVSPRHRFNAAVESLYAQGLRHFPLGAQADPVPVSPKYSEVFPLGRRGGQDREPMGTVAE